MNKKNYELKESDFLLNLINNEIFIITLPPIFYITDLIDMVIKENSIIFEFNKKKCTHLKDNKFTLIPTNEAFSKFLINKDNIKNSKVYICDIEEIKKREKRVFFIYS